MRFGTPFDFVSRLVAPLGQIGARFSKIQITLLSAVAILIIGVADYALGLQVSLSALHAAPITVTAWFVSPAIAFVLAALSVLVWIIGEVASGAHYSSWMVPVLNCALRLTFYTFFVVAIGRLSQLQRSLESLADERATLLAKEIAERERLEREMLEISEREQRRIGQDLHDGLCQHLTGTALAGHVLAETLAGDGVAQAPQARKIVDLVEESISLARGIAKGLQPVELQADGLMQALEEFAATTSELFGVTCRFECYSPVMVRIPATATHLYRIAQEGVSNAIKHGRATEIVVLLEETDFGVRLAVSDNGSGLCLPAPDHGGMGLKIMADRAKMVGGLFRIARSSTQGVELSCLIPQAALS